MVCHGIPSPLRRKPLTGLLLFVAILRMQRVVWVPLPPHKAAIGAADCKGEKQ